MSISRGKYIVLGEVSIVCSALRRDLQKANRWDSHDQQVDEDPQIQLFHELKSKLNRVNTLAEVSPIEFLLPFLEVIQCDELEGPITGLALSTVNKFLSYGLIDAEHREAGVIVERLAQAVTHARFRGTNTANDEVVLMKIIMVLRTLILTPIGSLLTNETVREIMISCFRICFTREFSELLRKTSEHTLVDSVQLLFSRLGAYRGTAAVSSLPLVTTSKKGVWTNELFKGKKKRGLKKKLVSQTTPTTEETPLEEQEPTEAVVAEAEENTEKTPATTELTEEVEEPKVEVEDESRDYNLAGGEMVTNQRPEQDVTVEEVEEAEDDDQQPFGLGLIIDLLDFVTSLINLNDSNNSDIIIKTGLSLITVALEVARDQIMEIEQLLEIVQTDLSKYLFQLLSCDKLSLVAASTRVTLLLFETMRHCLKYQLEEYLKKLVDIVRDENQNSYELKELLLEYLAQLFHLPGMATELYLNYDCDNHCTNLYEELTKLLSKQAFPATPQLYSTHLLSLDGLCTLIDGIEQNCQKEQEGKKPKTKNKARVYNLDSGVLVARRGAAEEETPPPPSRAHVDTTKHPPRFTSAAPSIDDIIAIKQRKKLFHAGSELFNQKPKKGIAFLREQGLFGADDWDAIAQWLRTNPALSKKEIGDYIGDRHNSALLKAFVNTFDFTGDRIDQGLRKYLNAFRLPGEAPVIQRLLEAFCPVWHKVNNNCYASDDDTMVLAYAIIMLNTDQHNQNVAKNATPMTPKAFKNNVRGCNGGQDFDQDMLDMIFDSIHNDEIVLPEEQSGLKRDEWLWKEIQSRAAAPEGIYLSLSDSVAQTYDAELFEITWGPTVHALGYAFDRSNDPSIIQKAVAGFGKCAKISAFYNKSDVFDNLIITLCKKTGLTGLESYEHVAHSLGTNSKARLAARAVFKLCIRHGDIVREGWRNILELLLPLYRASLLPDEMIRVDDFVDPSGTIDIAQSAASKNASKGAENQGGIFSSVYSFISGGAEGAQRDARETAKVSREYVAADLAPEGIVTESKFLRLESLHELVKALILESRPKEVHENMGTTFAEDSAVFYLEMLFRIVQQNRDRILTFWTSVKQHLIDIISSSTVYSTLLERAVTGLLRLGVRLLHREDLQQPVLQSLQILLLISPKLIPRLYRQIAYGIDEIIQKCGADIHSTEDWETIFLLLKTAGAGLILEKTVNEEQDGEANNLSAAASESDLSQSGISDTESESGATADLGYTSDNEPDINLPPRATTSRGSVVRQISLKETPESQNQFTLSYHVEVGPHDQRALVRSVDSLAFLVRDTAHVTPANFEICVDAIRAFVEASMNGVNKLTARTAKKSRRSHKSKQEEVGDTEASTEEYHKVSMQLLELMHTLHTRAGKIFRQWGDEQPDSSFDLANLWETGWCPLLQGIARLCCDARRGVRTTAFNYLSSSLLVQDLQVLSGSQWEACFHKVLFPLLNRLLDNISPHDPNSMDETRMRAASLLSKVFLQHLKDLLTSPTFTACWLTILDFMDKYMRVGNRDLLCEAIPESLKNMLLVMDTAGIFHTAESGYTDLWEVTWERIDIFLPNLKQELFRETQQPQHLMPPPVAQLAQTERLAAVPVVSAAPPPHQPPTPTPVQINDQLGVTVGISANPLYAQDETPPPAPAKQVNTLATQVEPLVKPATPPPPVSTPPVASGSVMSQSAPGLLFDPSILGSVPTVTPVVTTAPSPPTKEEKPVGLTRSDSLAAVIADLNQTLAMTSVSNDMPPATFPTASSLFTSSAEGGGGDENNAFDEL